MAQEIIIPQTRMIKARLFEALQVNGIETALAACIEAKHYPLYMPQVVDARIGAAKDSPLFQNWWTTPSVRVTGKSKGGKAVVVYGHNPNYFSDPANIKKAREEGLRYGAGIMPVPDFYALLDREDGKTVFVVDYDKLRAAESDLVSVSDALEHPQTIPFLGGRERAEQYLAKHVQVYGSRIGIWHSDDLDEKPRGRLLFLGYGEGDGLIGDYLDDSGCFVGVWAAEARECGLVREAPRKNAASVYSVNARTGPTMDELLTDAKVFVAPAAWAAFEKKVKARYQ
ncbi:hypothetical protein HY772_00615 [Candidatus Woesearchaeota archaeon]|nr:hypothetical protein [Candidatus Woesearchaeota archaeon]